MTDTFLGTFLGLFFLPIVILFVIWFLGWSFDYVDYKLGETGQKIYIGLILLVGWLIIAFIIASANS